MNLHASVFSSVYDEPHFGNKKEGNKGMSADRDPGSVNEKSWRNVTACVWHLAYKLIQQGSAAPGPVQRQHVL